MIKAIISGGGTGGHIYPAISIANALRDSGYETEILFVGAIGKMEMEKVPEAGYRIIGLPVAGLQRSLSVSNLALPFKVLKSLRMARKIIRDFRPDVIAGVGGYASAPMLWEGISAKIPCLIQEQNSYAGLTNKILGKRADRICVAYDGMERFFPAGKIRLTGNPIRKNISPATEDSRRCARKSFGIPEDGLPVVLIVGGSLGCGTFNRIMERHCRRGSTEDGFYIIWQSGRAASARTDALFKEIGSTGGDGTRRSGRIINMDFIKDMDMAFAASDLVVSRAGAGTISELCAAAKPAIFVPSEVVAEDHQTKNAMSLVEKGAALIVRDGEADGRLMDTIVSTLADGGLRKRMGENIYRLARPRAAEEIAGEILKLAGAKI
ncbi:MAG TPA: undecaprenyldiphospho-muramoylpentapeptide beta-N-acetylglucosaminyltransferase [Candidatus Coprenecus stercoripullorum]|nr:undecaprenyldiphospho-muramoylpentapeptide beta-N-acetylglucosaminyltransferase [Candidatus Coprenecus stercoripullorum]